MVDVEQDDRLFHDLQLLQGQNLEELVISAYPSGHDDKCVRIGFHDGFAHSHAFRKNDHIRVFVQFFDHGFLEKCRRHAHYMAAGVMEPPGGSSHHAAVSGSEHQGMASLCQPFAEIICGFRIDLRDLCTGCTVNAYSHFSVSSP